MDFTSQAWPQSHCCPEDCYYKTDFSPNQKKRKGRERDNREESKDIIETQTKTLKKEFFFAVLGLCL